jgi:hypothetical protein
MKTLIIVLTLLLSANAAQAGDMTGNDYLDVGDTAKLYLIIGLSNMATAFGEQCGIGNGQTYGQLKAVVDKYLADHPEKRNQEMSILYISAVYIAFDCLTASTNKSAPKTKS